MIQSGKDVEYNYFFLFILKCIYPLLKMFYNIKIIGYIFDNNILIIFIKNILTILFIYNN